MPKITKYIILSIRESNPTIVIFRMCLYSFNIYLLTFQVGIHHKLEYSRFENHCDHLRQVALEMDYIFIVPAESSQSQLSKLLALDTSQSPPRIQCMATPHNSYISTMRSEYLHTWTLSDQKVLPNIYFSASACHK